MASSGFYGAWKDNRGRHTKYPPGHHPIQTISDPPPSIPYLYARCPCCRNSPTLSWLGTNDSAHAITDDNDTLGGGGFEQIVAASCVTEINFRSLCFYSFVTCYLCQLTQCRTYNPETDQVKIGWRYIQKAPADGSYLWQLVVKQLTQLAKLWAVCPFWWQ